MKLFNLLKIVGIKKERLQKIHWVLGFHAFSIILFLVFLDIMLGIFLFYNYVIIIQIEKQDMPVGAVKFEYDKFQTVLKELEAKQQMFQENPSGAPDGSYQNPFTPI